MSQLPKGRLPEDMIFVGGLLRWAKKRGRARAGELVGGRNSKGYRLTAVDGRKIYVHRLVWQLYNGPIPEGMMIDHIDGDNGNNRIENLRLVTAQENVRNTRRHKHNSSGAMGVSFYKPYKKWKAYININRKQQHLGYFDDVKDAVRARRLAEKEFGFHDNHGRIAT